MCDDTFPGLVIDDSAFLDDVSERTPCSKCGKSRKYFCYSCCLPLEHVAKKIPKVKLPTKVDIIKHPNEIDGKSTSPHATIISPEDVTVLTYPCIPEYDSKKVILVFPCEDAVTLADLALKAVNKDSSTEKEALKGVTKDLENSQVESTEDKGPGNLHGSETSVGNRKRPNDDSKEKQGEKRPKLHNLQIPFERVVFIDSTWNQTRNIVNDERLKDLRKVELKSRETKFWRTQEGLPKTYLSTIEAIYYFVQDLHSLFIDRSYNHEYDNLLFFFCHMRKKIRSSGNNNSGKKSKAKTVQKK